MNSRTSRRKNLSSSLVALMATLVCTILNTAIAKAESISPEVNQQRLRYPRKSATLIAQVWSDIDTAELSLAVREVAQDSSSQSEAILITQLPPQQQQLIAQVWSDIETENLSLAVREVAQDNSPSETILITQLPLPQQQLIAQVWSDIETAELSLAVREVAQDSSQSEAILITQLPLPQQQLIAQVWSDIETAELSLAVREVAQDSSQSEAILITQLPPQQQQLIAQVWSDIETAELSLAVREASQDSSQSEAILITQLPPQQQQLIAQVWSDIETAELSLAEIETDAIEQIVTDQVLVEQLSPPEKELIAQVWSDIDTKQLSLTTTNQLPPIPPQPTAEVSSTELITQSKLKPEQELIAQAWSKLDRSQLSLSSPVEQFDEIAALSSPFVNPTPATRVPSKAEIAARIILNKVKIITPAPGVIVNGQSNSSVTIQYPANTRVKLEVNGAEVDNTLVTREQLDFNTNLITQTWQGAKLNEGNNQVTVIAHKGGFSKETTRDVIVKDDTSQTEETAAPVLANQAVEANQIEQNVEPDNSAPQSSINNRPSEKLVKILSPKPYAVLKNISSSVIIQFPEEASVILQVNGKSVNPSQVGRTEVNAVTKLVTQTWYGVIFESGTNELSVLATTDGKNYSETKIEVKVPGKPEALKVGTVESFIPADGQTVTTVKGKFLDSQGEVAFWNETITLNSSQGKFVGTDLDPDRPGFQVRTNNGKFSASLQAGYDAEQVTIKAKSSQLEAYTQIEFKNALREKPLLTGYADLRIGAGGTDYFDSFRDFLPLDEDNDATIDFDSAAFITGSIGRWAYTGAYNSDRSLNEDSRGENRLFRTYSNSDQIYPIYGDSSTTEVVAPSIDRVYFLLERSSRIEFAEPDYFMWGDYDTEEFSTESQEFSAISRQLHGFKSNYNLGRFQLNALYANNVEGFQRDAIAPDGTSGFYFLSRRLLIPGSEDIYLELTPLNDPGNVVRRESLTLGIDYEIDYDRGTLLFKDPLLLTQVDQDGNILVRRLVATYQFESEASDSDLIAGRLSYYFDRDFDSPTWLGTTYLSEDRGDQDFELFGVDAYVSLGKWGSLIGEYATSDNKTIFADANGSAYRFEGEVNFSDSILGRAYYREASEGFANNATLSFVPGQTRFGGELTAKVANNTDLNFLYERQSNNGVAPRPLDELEDFLDLEFDPVPGSRVDNSVSTITAGVAQQIGDADLSLDLTYRDRTDNTVTGDLTSTSTQLRSHFSLPVVDKLTFHALNDLTLSDDTDAVFSDRIGVGLDWEFYSGLSLVLNQQWFTRGNLAGEALTTVGLQGDYEPWANATITGRYSMVNGVSGINNTGSVGLQQKIPIAPGLDLDLDYERTFSDFNPDGTGTQFAQPFAVGQSAFALGFDSGSTYGVGIKYSDNPDFTADARLQFSDRSENSNTVLSAGVTGKLTRSLTSLFSFNQASSANQTFDIGTTRNIRLGMAYRDPQQDKFNALLRYEYEEDGGLIPETILFDRGTGSRDHLFAGEMIFAPHWRWEFYSKLAFRNSRTFIADDFVSSSNISLGQLRASYRLNYHLDLVAEVRGIWQPSADYTETGLVLEAGYYLTPELRLSAGYVFGSADDEDFTGTRSAGGPYLGMTVKLNGLLDGFGQHRPPSMPEGVSNE